MPVTTPERALAALPSHLLSAVENFTAACYWHCANSWVAIGGYKTAHVA